MKHLKEYTAYASGALGHDAFYATLSTYLTLFVTSQLFTTSNNSFNQRMITSVTVLIMGIRILEVFCDPLIGGVVDNTKTRWGKFKPWIVGGAIVSALMLALIFTDFGGLAYNAPTVYLILFGIAFVILDIFFSFNDIAFWSLLPALSTSSKTRSLFGTVGRFGSTIGAQGVPMIIFPVIIFFSQLFSGTHGSTKTQSGWFGFAIVIGIVAVAGAIFTAVSTKEKDSLIRSETKKTHVKDVFRAIGENDQLMWQGLSYFLFALSYVVTNSLLAYYFQYVLGRTDKFFMIGVITTILGIISVVLFPSIELLIKRKAIYIGGICLMLIGYTMFLVAGTNLMLVYIVVGIFFFPYPMIFLAALMTITDSVEYGQWKNGTRNESVTLSVRPLIDKLAGALANGLVILAAVNSGMVGNAKPSSIAPAQLLKFKGFMFFAPMILLVVSAFIYLAKVKLTEKKHQEIVNALQAKLSAEQQGN